MQESANETQLPEKGQERFTSISEIELNSLLESRLSKATKSVTNWAVSTFKGR